MSRKEILIICFIICFIFSLQAVAAAGDLNTTHDAVLTTDSDVSAYSLPNQDIQLRSGSENAGTFSDLQKNITGKTSVTLVNNFTYDTSADSGLANGINISSPLTIDGQGKVIIDANKQARVFNIAEGVAVTLKGITFINANANGDGGSIASHGVLTLMDCTFINNTASGHGGAVYLDHSTRSTIENCDFNGNVAGLNGGAIDWRYGSTHGKVINSTFTNNTAKRSGGAIHWSGHDGTIRDSIFTNNTATGEVTSEFGGIDGGGDGGAVLWVGSNGTVDNCKFINNKAIKNDTTKLSGRGGAIFLHGNITENCTNTTVSNSIFRDNSAGLNGGAIDWQEGAHEGNVYNSTFTHNIANANGGAIFWAGYNGEIHNSNFTNNSAEGTVTDIHGNIGDGGAIIWSGINGTITNSRFINNSANQRGGAAFLQNCTHGNCTNTSFAGCTFISNFAGINGGALDWHDGAHDGSVYNSIFTHNTAGSNGGAIFWAGHNGEILDSNFTSNTAKGTLIDIHGNIGDGGAIIWSGINGTVDNCRFIDNEAKFNDSYTFGGRGGAVYLQNCTHGNCENTTFTNVYFENNVAGTNGGAIDWHAGAHDGLVENATFINNTARRSGGAIFWNGHNGTIRYTKFYNNRALGEVNATSVLGPVTSGGDGGAVMWSGALGDLEYCNFVNNTAAKRGGAIFLQASEEENSDNTTFRHSYFKNNTAGTNGGAIDWNKGSHNGIVDNVTFIDNTAKRSGGAIFWFGMNGTVINSKFINNSALGSALANDSFGNMTYGGHGGAIMWTGSNGKIQNVTFDKNTAEVNGGAVFLQGSKDYGNCENIVVKDSQFTNNFAGTNGGALDWYKGALNGTVDNCTFINNTALSDGGAIFWEGYYGIINASVFENNRAVGLGNGALISTTVNPNTNETENRYNITGGDGGAIKWIGSHGIVVNTTFYRNNASYNGGSIYLSGNATENCTNITFIDCDFTENLAKLNGGAVFWATGASNATVKGSRFISNTALRSAGAIYVNGNYLEIKDTEFISNEVTRTQTYDNRTGSSYFTSIGGNAGAICWMGSYGTVDNGTFINNTANGRGGAIQFERNRDGIVKNSLFENNSANDDGGAIDWYLGAINGQLINSTFKSNYIVGNKGSGAGVYIEGYNATIKDSRFYDHYTNLDGGAVFVAGDECKIVDSTFERNSVGDDGGAIYWEGNNGTIVNITCHDNHGVSYNTSTSRGGAVSLIGSNITITKSKFTFNDVSYSEGSNMSKLDGGAMLITGRNITISDTEFSNNYALNYGGAIMIVGNETTIDNCTFDTSNATRGGSIYVDGHNATISAAFKNTNATLSGGAIYVNGENATIVNSSFDSTYAFGSVNNGGGAIMVNGNFTSIEKSNFTNTHADNNYEARGGAIYIKGVATNITDSKFEHSRSSRYGGSIYINGTNTTIRESNFIDCTVNSDGSQGGAIYVDGEYTSIIGSDFDMNTAKEEGGAIYIHGLNTTISYSTFENNKVDGNGGGAIYVNGDNAIIEWSNFTKNEANVKDDAKGGVIYVEGEYTLIEGCNFVNSTAKFRGGALYIDGANVKVKDSNFTDSSIRGGKYGVNNPRGGAIYIKAVDAVVEGSIFNHSTVSSTVGEGGAIYIEGNRAKILGSGFDSSSANTGGAIYLEGNNTYVNASSVNGSYAESSGAALYSKGSNSNVEHSNFTNNLAKLNGGALYWDGGGQSRDNTVDGCIFTNNTAYGYTTHKDMTRGGGAIYWSEGGTRGTVKNSEFYYNSVQSINKKKVDGGAILWDKSTNALVENCIFVGNFVTTDGDDADTQGTGVWAQGGAMYLRSYGNYIVRNCHFENCSSSKEAGALYIQSNGGDDRKALVENCKFINNVAYAKGENKINGGGAIQVKQANHVELKNVTFINNTANKGGALCVFDSVSDLVVDGANFTSNKADRGSAISASRTFTLKNAVLLENRATTHTFNLTFDRTGSIGILLQGKDNRLNAMYVSGSSVSVKCTNVTYWTNNNISTGKKDVTSKSQSSGSIPIPEAGISITVEIFDANNNKLNVGNDIFATGADGKLQLTPANFNGISSFENVYVVARLTNEDYYTQVVRTTRLPTEMQATAYNVTYHCNATVNVTIHPSPQYVGAASGIVSVYYNDTFLGNITIADDKGISYEISTFLGDRYLNVGKHNLTLRYWGDLYNDAVNLTVPINVNKADSTVKASVVSNVYGPNVTISINSVNATSISVVIKDKSGNVVYNNSTALPNGNLVLPVLDVGEYTIDLTTNVDGNHKAATNQSSLTIVPATSSVKINPITNVTYGTNTIINFTVTNATEVSWEIRDKSTSEIVATGTGLNNISQMFAVGKYTISITNIAKGNYNASTASKDFEVYKAPSDVIITKITNATYGYDVTIEYEVINKTSITVEAKVKDQSVIVPQSQIDLSVPGKITIKDLDAGEYEITIKNIENQNYTESSAIGYFRVSKYLSNLILVAEDDYVGNDIILNAIVTGVGGYPVNGVVNVIYNGTAKQINIVNGEGNISIPNLKAGHYIVSGIFTENDVYLKSENGTSFNVKRYQTTLDLRDVSVNVGDYVVLEARVTGVDGYSVNGTVTVVGQRSNYTISVVDGYGNVTVGPLPAGEYVVSGVFGETEYYLKSDDGAKIVVSRYPSNLVIFDVEGMVGNYFKLVANVTGVDKYPVNGTVKVIGHKSNYTIDIVNGTGFTLINALEAGTFIVEGVFAETDYYLKSGDNATIIISKYSSNLEINIDDIEVGEPLVIKVKVTGNATVIPNGTVTVTINHKDYVINLTGGEGNVSIENLPANYYVVSGIYSGDSIYDNAEGFANVTISKHPSQLIIESSNIKVGDKEIINLTVVDMNNTPVNANGYAIVQGMRGEYNITIVNGKGNRTFDDLPAGHYILTGIFYGGPIYAKSENNARTEFDVTKYQSTITININDTKVDELVFAEVIVSEGGSGNVSLTLAGKEYNLTVENGKGYINLTRLSVVNTYIVTGIYYGDNHYSKSEGTTSFKVEKYPSNVEIILDNETYHSGEQINVLVKVTDGATGNVTLTVGNLTKTVILNGGVGTWNISSLPNGLYSIAALYNGDYKYRTSGSSKQFSVNATAGMDVTINATINASAENIRIGDAVYVNINITGDYGIPTGNVTVLISGLTYPGVLNQNGTVTVAIPGLEARDYVAIITYSGDDVYSSNSTQIQFTVLKWDSQVNVTVESIYVLDLANVTVAVTDGATGNVSVILNRQTYNIELVNGKGSKLIPNLPASDEEYLVEVTYLGDNSYQKSENHTSFRVNKYKPSVLVDVQNIYVGQDVNITIKITGNASVNATGEATFVLDGKNYTVAIVNGTGNISVSGLKENNYNVPVIYYGDAVYLKGEGNGAFKVSKYDSKMVIDVDPIYVGENLTINITIEGVPGINASGKVDIFIGGKHYDVEIINGKGSIDNITNLTVGKHDFTVTYYGDDNYTKTDAGSSAIVNAHMPTIKINVTDIKVGETEFVNVTVVGVDGVVPSGQIQILVNNHDEVVTLNENGTAIIPISDLAASDEPYILEAIYYGDDYYAKGTGKGSFNVTRFDSSVRVVVGDIKVGETEFVNVTVVGVDGVVPSGEVDFIIGGQRYSGDLVDGVVSIPVAGLSASDEPYLIEVVYYGDSNYTKGTGNGTFNVVKWDPTVNITVDDIKVGENATVRIVVADGDAKGKVQVLCNGKTETFDLVNGEVTFDVSDLEVGPYYVVVDYLGDNKYNKAYNQSSFFVVTGESTLVVEAENITYGEPANITVKVSDNAVGTVRITVNGVTYERNLTDGTANVVIDNLDADNYEVSVEYLGDKNHKETSTSTVITVAKAESSVNSSDVTMQYGQSVNIEVTAQNTTGVTYGIVDENGTVVAKGTVEDNVFTPPVLDSGNYTVRLTTNVDKNHNSVTAEYNLTVNRASSSIEANETVADYGEPITIEVRSENVTGVTYEIVDENGNVVASGTVEDGTLVVPELDAGNYTVRLTGEVDKNHDPVTEEIDLVINRASSSIEANETVADYGEPTTIEVRSENVTGVSYEIVDENGNVVASGTVEDGTLVVPELGAGNYTVRLTAEVDKNHDSTTREIGLTVNPTAPSIDVDANNITYGEDEVITVTLPKDATGNVTITIDGVDYEVPIENGVAKLTLPDLAVGNHTVKVHYPGDNNYNPVDSSATVNVAKAIPVIRIEAVDIWHGEVEVLNITVNAPGSVNVTVNGVTVTLELGGEAKDTLFSTLVYVLRADHKATWNLYNLPVGHYPVYAVYNGNDNYQIVANSTSFNVRAIKTTIKASAPDIKLGEDATITVKVSPSDATGNVTVVIDGKKYNAPVKDGKAVITIPNLSEGLKTAKVYYSGDENHTSGEAKVTFRVGRMPSKALPSGANIHVGDDEKITVNVPKDATGKVTITVGGKQYSSDVNNGKAVFKIKGLKAGKYDILAAYSGDDEYLPSNGSAHFTVSKVKPPVDVSTPKVKVTENGKVVVTLPSDATGTVTIEVDGKKYTAPVKNGVAVFSIPGLKIGDHKIKVYYSGDAKYSPVKSKSKLEVVDNGNGHGKNGTNHNKHGERVNEKSGVKVGLENYPTGNPILLLLLVILAIGSTQIRRFRK